MSKCMKLGRSLAPYSESAEVSSNYPSFRQQNEFQREWEVSREVPTNTLRRLRQERFKVFCSNLNHRRNSQSWGFPLLRRCKCKLSDGSLRALSQQPLHRQKRRHRAIFCPWPLEQPWLWTVPTASTVGTMPLELLFVQKREICGQECWTEKAARPTTT